MIQYMIFQYGLEPVLIQRILIGFEPCWKRLFLVTLDIGSVDTGTWGGQLEHVHGEGEVVIIGIVHKESEIKLYVR